jgi:translation initiation factor 2 beta subunit (eIF-2beta)/eIF-5
MRPYVICHMCTSLDGKIIGHRWGRLPGYKHESELPEQAGGVSWRFFMPGLV